ncbi:MAG: hypothetical protein V5A44_09590 [Haloarculaceae archaeon]
MSITDWLPGTSASGYVHYECRDCGRNLTASDDACPACGGPPAEYALD